jgi:N-methylhydantoinase A
LLTLGRDVVPDIAAAFDDLQRRAEGWFEEEGVAPPARQVARTVDMRYAGQNYELPVPLPEGPVTGATVDAVAEGFAAAHKRMYGFVAEDEPVQLVTFRVEATGMVPKAALQPRRDAGPDASAAIVGRRDVWLVEDGRWTSCPVYERDRLDAGNVVAGPAIVEQMDATTVIPPGCVGRVEPYLNLILESA